MAINRTYDYVSAADGSALAIETRTEDGILTIEVYRTAGGSTKPIVHTARPVAAAMLTSHARGGLTC